MVQRSSVVFWIVAMAVVVAVAATAVSAPVASLAFVLVPVLVYFTLRKMDLWRILTVGTLLSLAAESSNQAFLVSAAAPLRFAFPAGICALLLAKPHSHRSLPVRVRWWGGLILTFTAASVAWSANPMESAVQVIALVLIWGAIYLSCVARWTKYNVLIQDLVVVYWALVAIVLACLAVGIVGLPEARSYDGRFEGLFASATTLGLVAALAIPLGLGLSSQRRGRVLYAAGTAALLTGLVLSGSRGAVGSVVLGALYVVWRRGSTGVLRYLVPAVAILSLVILATPLLKNTSPLMRDVASRISAAGGGDFTSGRMEAWDAAVLLWKERLIGGHGYRTTESLFEGLRAKGDLRFTQDTAHNQFLAIAVELGAIGLILVAGLIASIARHTFRSRESLGFALSTCLVVGLGTQLFEAGLFGTGSVFAFAFWLLAGAAVVESREADGWTRVRRTNPKSARSVAIAPPMAREELRP